MDDASPTPKLNKFDRSHVMVLLEEFHVLLSTLGEWYGITFEFVEGCRFTPDALRLGRILVRTAAQAGQDEEAEFRNRAKEFGLLPTDLGAEFLTYGEKIYHIIGAIPGAPLTCAIRAGNKYGDRTTFSAAEVRSGLIRIHTTSRMHPSETPRICAG